MRGIGFGIIGCGAIAPLHAQSIAQVENARLVAVADVFEERARALGAQYGAEAYSDYRELLKRRDVDAVSLCVPSGMRLELAQACAAAGKHILAEKPLEVTTERVDQVVRATDRAGVRLACIFQYRFADGPQQVKQALSEGRFGRLVLGDAYIKWFRSQEYYESGSWRGTRQLDGGGVLMNQGIHQIDLLLWFMGPVRSVLARKGLIGHEGLDVEDTACALLEFHNGAMGVIEGSTAVWPGQPARVEVHGTEGSIALDDGELRSWRFRHEQPQDEQIRGAFGPESAFGSGANEPIRNLKVEGHRRQFEDFVRAIMDSRPPRIDGREARHAVQLIEAIYRSADSGASVDVS